MSSGKWYHSCTPAVLELIIQHHLLTPARVSADSEPESVSVSVSEQLRQYLFLQNDLGGGVEQEQEDGTTSIEPT